MPFYALTGARSRLVSGFVRRLGPLSGQVGLGLRRVRRPVNTVAIRRPVRALKVTIKHAGGAPFIVTTFTLFVARYSYWFNIKGTTLRILVHECSHRRCNGTLVFGTAIWRHGIRRAIFRRRRWKRKQIVGL